MLGADLHGRSAINISNFANIQGLSEATTHYGWQVRVNMLTERASQVRRFSVYMIWFILRRRYFGNWNNLTAVRAINCDVPLVVLRPYARLLDPALFAHGLAAPKHNKIIASRLFHNAQLNVEHVTINSIGRFMDCLARMKPTIGYGASCNRVLPRVREVRPDPCSPVLMRWRSS